MILSKKNLILIIILAIIIAVFLYITEFRSKPIGWQPDEVVLMDKPPVEVLNPQNQINFGNELPEGFPSDMPIDPKPVRVLQSSVRSSQNQPPDPDYNLIAYSYVTRQDIKETFDVLKDYAARNGFTVKSEEDGLSMALFASKGDDEKLNITIYAGTEETVVTIIIAKKQN
ncbi:MAG: hypothetical protein HYX20_01010 [Candidatus Yanofskybacteria bacterium]|nr:hypothetical protein [Candidatus Yanofskybacteria bacterium]